MTGLKLMYNKSVDFIESCRFTTYSVDLQDFMNPYLPLRYQQHNERPIALKDNSLYFLYSSKASPHIQWLVVQGQQCSQRFRGFGNTQNTKIKLACM